MPFTGIVMATANDPIQRSYKDGKWVEFDANGLLKTKSEFEHGLTEHFNKDGQVSSSYKFENGEMVID